MIIKEAENGLGVIIYKDGEEIIRDKSSRIILSRHKDYKTEEKEIAMMGTTISFLFKHAQYYAESNNENQI
jgi:hypothetical protein